jgi:hypothetical protein
MLLEASNPNLAKPTLGLASLRRVAPAAPGHGEQPASPDRIGVVVPSALHQEEPSGRASAEQDRVSEMLPSKNVDSIGIEPVGPRSELNPDVAGHHVDAMARPAIQSDPPARKKPKRRPPASTLPWPPHGEWLPAISIVGNTVPDEQIRPDKNVKLAAKFWARRVAFETALDLPEADREACERFVLRHRLSILAAFHRRLARVVVVEALRELFHAENN